MDDKVVILKNYDSMAEALLDHEILSKNKIMSTINSEDASEILPMLNEINEGLKIMVFEKDPLNASKILTEFHSADSDVVAS